LLHKLRAELASVVTSDEKKSAVQLLMKLEKLSYLTAAIKEVLYLSYGVLTCLLPLAHEHLHSIGT
jgi:hypothetical protein